MTTKYAAVNIDGVLLTDTFSSIIHDFIIENGGIYDENTERSILSQPQSVGGAGMARATGKDWTSKEAIARYFEKRAGIMAKTPPEVSDGAPELLDRLKKAGYRLISYGGLSIDHFYAEAGDYAHLFDDPVYVCTNKLRPGVREICNNVLKISYSDLLVIDDVARVGIEAKRLGMPFIGHPSHDPHSHQRKLMADNGVTFVNHLSEIDEAAIGRAHADAVVS